MVYWALSIHLLQPGDDSLSLAALDAVYLQAAIYILHTNELDVSDESDDF